MNFKLLSAAAIISVSAFSAQAAEVFFEDFDEVPAGSAITNFATAADSSNLDQFTVTAGTVDAYTNGGFNLPCTSLGCLDLDGSLPGAETILVSDAINLLAGDYSLSFQIAGNQRGGASDTVSVSVEVGLLSSTSFTLSPNDGFRIETLGFSVLSDTNANIRFLHAGPLDNVGILLDWVKLEGDPIDPVPVPASLPLLAGGFALFGALGMRRKKKA